MIHLSDKKVVEAILPAFTETFHLNPFLTGNGVMVYAGKNGFRFEDDFVEDNVRCIPMIVRFKLDLAGIKLKLAEWSRFETEERKQLTALPCITAKDKNSYKKYLELLIRWRAGGMATELAIEENPVWANMFSVPEAIMIEAGKYHWLISLKQWRGLNNLQRFTLFKLSKPGHENRNFPNAMAEFGFAALMV